MSKLTALYRHPLKSHGRESLDQVTLSAGDSMPYDRLWAVAHDAAKTQAGEWAACQNFSRGAKAPGLMAIDAVLNETTEELTLSHPTQEKLSFHPDRDIEKFLKWVVPLVPADRAQPAQIFRLDQRGYTDTPFASISLCNTASHSEVEQRAGEPLSPLRWRGNIWLDGLAPWVEFDWIGREISIGDVRLHVRERTTRCLATTANPLTGMRDVDTLAALSSWDHQDFGVYAEVIQGGTLRLGDEAVLH